MGELLHPLLANVAKVTSDGIEPPLSDLESEVLPLHHEACALWDWSQHTLAWLAATAADWHA